VKDWAIEQEFSDRALLAGMPPGHLGKRARRRFFRLLERKQGDPQLSYRMHRVPKQTKEYLGRVRRRIVARAIRRGRVFWLTTERESATI
jgi:hypothetical protein